MTRIEIPTLRTRRLLLRGMRADDLGPFAAMNANPEVTRYLGSGRTRNHRRNLGLDGGMLGQWGLRGFGMFALEDAATGRFVGRTGYCIRWTGRSPNWLMAWTSRSGGRGWLRVGRCRPRLGFFQSWPEAARQFRAAGQRRLDRRAAQAGAVRTGTLTLLGSEAERWEHHPDGAGGKGHAVMAA